jgi:DNA-binding IclR family transcriptional regulator
VSATAFCAEVIKANGSESRPAAGGTQSVPAVEKVFSILEVLANSSTGLTLRDLAKMCDLPKSSVHCILITLERSGYLHRNQRTSRYLFGRKLLLLANHALGGLELCEHAEPHMRSLCGRLRLPVHLGIVECDEAAIVAKADYFSSSRPVKSWIGKRMELHCTGIGKALISNWPSEELERLAKERNLSRHNDNTIWSLKRLSEELQRVRRLGYAVDDEEDVLGLRCVGAPIVDADGDVIAAISVYGTTSEITENNVDAIAVAVRAAAQTIGKLPALNTAVPQMLTGTPLEPALLPNYNSMGKSNKFSRPSSRMT